MSNDAFTKFSPWPYAMEGRNPPNIRSSSETQFTHRAYIEQYSQLQASSVHHGLVADAVDVVDARALATTEDVVPCEQGYVRDVNAARLLLNTTGLPAYDDGKSLDAHVDPPHHHIEPHDLFDFASEYDLGMDNNPASFEGELSSLPCYEDFVWFFGS
jgi:hypothetical protein